MIAAGTARSQFAPSHYAVSDSHPVIQPWHDNAAGTHCKPPGDTPPCLCCQCYATGQLGSVEQTVVMTIDSYMGHCCSLTLTSKQDVDTLLQCQVLDAVRMPLVQQTGPSENQYHKQNVIQTTRSELCRRNPWMVAATEEVCC